MIIQERHPLLPEANHDEGMRQDFVHDLRVHLARNVAPHNKKVWNLRGEPQFFKTHGRKPESATEVKSIMTKDSIYQFWSAMQRNSQEMIWYSVIDSVERQFSDLAEKSKQLSGETGGTLEIDKNFKVPHYLSTHDIHLMPGNYHSSFSSNDVSCGAIYEAGGHLYGMGLLGSKLDMLGLTNIELYTSLFPNSDPGNILDMGCAMGNCTLPWAEKFPDARVSGIDVGESILRYGHARAESLGVKVHFSQQNAEKTNFEDNSFDVIVSHIMMHETSSNAVPEIFSECRRLLKSGGVMMHLDLPRFEGMDPVDEFLSGWEIENNCEYFAGTWRSMDIQEAAVSAGWKKDEIRIEETQGHIKRKDHPYSAPNPTWPVLIGVKN